MADFGLDLAASFDLDPGMQEAKTPRQILAQAIVRRLITPRGFVIDDPLYGYDVRSFLSDDRSQKQLRLMKSQVEQELLKDERILQAIATVTFFQTTLNIVIQITDADGPFPLILNVDAVTVTAIEEQ